MSIQKRKDFGCKNLIDCDIKPYHPLCPTVASADLGSLTAPIRISSLIKLSTPFLCHRRTISIIPKLIPYSQIIVQRSSRSMSMPKACPNHLNLFLFNACSKGWNLGFRNIRPTPESRNCSRKICHSHCSRAARLVFLKASEWRSFSGPEFGAPLPVREDGQHAGVDPIC